MRPWSQCALIIRVLAAGNINGSNTGRWYSTSSAHRPVPRTDLSRTPSLSSTTLSAPAFGRTFNSTYLCRSLLMRRFNRLCALLVRCIVVAGVRWMSYTSVRYCYRCCFPQQVRIKRAAACGQFHAPILHARRVFRRPHSQLLHSAERLIRLTCAVAYSCADSILFVPY